MIYTLFIYTVVAAAGNIGTLQRDWRPLATVESAYPAENNTDTMLAKCAGIARELNISNERYRCIRTK